MITTTAINGWYEQGTLEPGEPGWWKVWGAQVRHIRPGDIFIVKSAERFETIEVEATFTAKAYPMRFGLVDAATHERFTLGALVPIVLVRQGTHNTLA